MKKELIIQQIKKKIRSKLPLDYKILLFGSWARGDALKTSDLDIGMSTLILLKKDLKIMC